MLRTRQVRRNPGFSIIAVATLALGIGVNTTMCGAVDAILIRPIPYHDADRLVMIWDEMSHIGFPKHAALSLSVTTGTSRRRGPRSSFRFVAARRASRIDPIRALQYE